MKLYPFSYRFADEVLDSLQFRQQKHDIIAILKTIAAPALAVPKKPRSRSKNMNFTTDQRLLNVLLEKAFAERGWQVHPSVTGDQKTKIAADFKKDRVQVEVQFGNMARWYTDVFKFQVSYSQDLIDVGVLVVPTQKFANTIDENVAYFERVKRELPYAKMSITLPIWLVGIEPTKAKHEQL